jgi:hypothetical protein
MACDPFSARACLQQSQDDQDEDDGDEKADESHVNSQ